MDILTGTLYNDDLSGNSDNIYIFGDAGNDTLSLAYGNSILDGWSGNDTLLGNSENNLLLGYTGDDNLTGAEGNDILAGEAGNDILNGYGQTSYEYDYLIGGTGLDVFVIGDESGVFYQEAGYVTISDFELAEGDTLQVFGNAEDYSLSEFYGGMDIYYQDSLIAYVANTTDISFENDFSFV